MTTSDTRGRLLLAALCALLACGDNLLRDPSFDLWCGDELCAPWEASGEIRRVGTWHAHDYGVSLEDGAAVSQLSDHAPVECIELEVIADVDAGAQVQLELDFLDDGNVEYTQLVPESHWARLRYLVKPPSWYEDMRFTLRKLGKGRAVLAQIKATPGDGCKGKGIELRNRPLGARCEQGQQCNDALCAPIDPLSGQTCSLCAEDADCAQGKICGVTVHDAGAARVCGLPDSRPLGALCAHDAECDSGVCCDGSCAECCSSADCGDGETCARSSERWLTVMPKLCDAGMGLREAGHACTEDSDCAGDDCDLEDDVCYLRAGERDVDCSFARRLAGTCR